MSRRSSFALALLLVIALAAAVWLMLARVLPMRTGTPAGTSAGVFNAAFTRRAVGDGLQAGEHPQIAHVAIVDLDRDGDPDLARGGMHISRPYDRPGRVTAWFNDLRAGR